jgi:hypothetical protein
MGGTYLYGIVEGAEEANLGVTGVSGGSPVRVLGVNGLGCAVSEYGGPELSSLSRETVLRCLLRHQQVVEHVMQGRTVLPVKFGTILEGPEEVRALLAQVHADLEKALDLMRDKVEVEVAATWDLRSVLNEMGHEEEVARAREAIAGKHRGEACRAPTLEDKVRLGQVVKACLDRRRDAYRERMLDVLQPLAVGVAPNALVAEEMVMNVAFLVQRARQVEFDERVRELDSIFDNRVTFRVIGPLPPYSFSTVQVTRLSGEQVEQARQELEIPNVFAEAEVRRAYRRLVAQGQRTAQGDVKTPADRLASLRRASEVLLACCRTPNFHHGGDGMAGNGLVGCLFAIAVRGTGYQEINAARFGGAVRV